MATYGIDIITGLPYLITSDEGITFTEPEAIQTNANYGIDVVTGEGYITTSDIVETTNTPVANPTNYVYGVDLVTDEKYVVGLDGKIPAHDYTDIELVNEFKIDYNLFKEFTTVDNEITQINYWSDNTKLKKLFTKDITYTNGNPTVITIKDEITNKILTTTIVYSGDEVLNITKTIS